MKLCIDNANISKIQYLYSTYNIDGVSTNPSILLKEGRKPYEVLKEIREFIGQDSLLFVQTVGTDVNTIQAEAERICTELGSNTIIKIPANKEGLKAINILSDTYRVLATAIYSPAQALLACNNGAEWLAPYVNRITKLGGNGIDTTFTIQDIIDNNNFNSKILAASFHNNDEVIELARRGVAALTISPDMFDTLINLTNVGKAINNFITDFEMLTSNNKNMSNL